MYDFCTDCRPITCEQALTPYMNSSETLGWFYLSPTFTNQKNVWSQLVDEENFERGKIRQANQPRLSNRALLTKCHSAL
jgi:hypothetical protein